MKMVIYVKFIKWLVLKYGVPTFLKRDYLVLFKGSNWLGMFISGPHSDLHPVAFCTKESQLFITINS